jgi:hypothetical protein
LREFNSDVLVAAELSHGTLETLLAKSDLPPRLGSVFCS